MFSAVPPLKAIKFECSIGNKIITSMGFLSCWSFLWDIIIHNEKHLSTVIETEGCQGIETRICALPDDLLLRILCYVPTKDAVATSILSKRWRYVWTMLGILEFKDDGSESVGWFTENSLQLHKAPKLESLTVQLGPRCPVDVDVGKWVENGVNRGVEELDFKLLWTAQPTSFPECLYTCDTLVDLTLSNQILVDVSFPARLPSLLYLTLAYVVYKDEDSLFKLLSSSSVLKRLIVSRREDDNLKNFTVKVSSLETLIYEDFCLNNEVEDNEVDEVEDNDLEVDEEEDVDGLNGLLMIESPSLTKLDLIDVWDYCLIENMSCLDNAFIGIVPNHVEKFLRSLSSVIHLHLFFTKSMVASCNAIKFSRLIEFYFRPDDLVDWLEPLMSLLQNSPKLKTLTIDTEISDHPLSWNQSSSISGCLLSHLEILRWRDYGGREYENKLLDYILANSNCLKTVEISLLATCNLEETQKELESVPRISTSSQLLISIISTSNLHSNGMEV
ncbi:PREDICTED: putative F-box/FBD/LRR-repeat protein At1g22000 [Camelina sativa]|uniref:F-box/FBD/LRR-repeat protein At1g22000 n=1 Tax=Camelina sativa TaxID=90675 RepID=A0ABM1R606_CAMSA|nr:PREDICTED: putative F-box/FBD/LRR-repeat protein At1g22000 [Camelina sativa]